MFNDSQKKILVNLCYDRIQKLKFIMEEINEESYKKELKNNCDELEKIITTLKGE